jgi:anti-anti-sigma factor
MNDLARVDAEDRGGLCLVRVRGDVDISNADEVGASIQAAMPDGASTLVVDLTDARYLDSAGIRLLFLLAERLRARRLELRLIVPEESPMRTVLELTGLPRVVPLESHLDDMPST